MNQSFAAALCAIVKQAALARSFGKVPQPARVSSIVKAPSASVPGYVSPLSPVLDRPYIKVASIQYRGHTFPGYNQPIHSSRRDKKRMVLARVGDRVKLIHFGQVGYRHNYSEKAKRDYLRRSAGIRRADGTPTKNDKLSANYWARRELWPAREPADGTARSSLHKQAALLEGLWPTR